MLLPSGVMGAAIQIGVICLDEYAHVINGDVDCPLRRTDGLKGDARQGR
jgi:hypothetical protein